MMQSKDYHDFVKQIAETHPSILGTGMIENGKLVSSFAKPEAPLPPKEQKLAFMFAQAHLLVEIPMTNEDYFGRVKYTMIEHDRLHVYLFPLEAASQGEDRFRRVLFVIAGPNYSHEELISKIFNYF